MAITLRNPTDTYGNCTDCQAIVVHKDHHKCPPAPEGLEMVDVEFMVVGVDKAKAETRRAELRAILDAWPQPERLAGGPSYIEVGGVIGDQGAAFLLFALGKVLGLWGLITPASMGITGPDAREMAGAGFVMITGYRPERAAA